MKTFQTKVTRENDYSILETPLGRLKGRLRGVSGRYRFLADPTGSMQGNVWNMRGGNSVFPSHPMKAQSPQWFARIPDLKADYPIELAEAHRSGVPPLPGMSW